jgi:hypothetical protein
MEIDLMVTVYALSAFGWTVSAVIFLVIWVAIAFSPDRVARRKGTASSVTSSSACSFSRSRRLPPTWFAIVERGVLIRTCQRVWWNDGTGRLAPNGTWPMLFKLIEKLWMGHFCHVEHPF